MKASVQTKILSWGIDKNTPLVVGVSGGPDSLALLHLLFVSGFNLIAVNVDHKLRDQSGVDAEFVKDFCNDRDIKYKGVIVDTPRQVEEEGFSIEEAARKLRYRELFRIANEVNAQAVCVGHNADDQIETVMMHLLRGAGLSGLSGMNDYSINLEWDMDIPVIRPLLSIWRDEIDSYCELNGLSPVQDLTNQDNRYFRNKIRNELLPYLVEYNPNIRKSLFQMAEIISSDFEIIQNATNKAWASSVISFSTEIVEFDREKLSEYPRAIQSYLFRKAINFIRSGLRDISFNTMQIIFNALDSKESGEHIDLINNLSLTFNMNEVFVHDSDHKFEVGHGLQLQDDVQVLEEGSCYINPSWKIILSSIENSRELMETVKNNSDSNIAFINGDLIKNLYLKKVSEGDRFSPLGMGGHSVKISDYFINQKVPRRERENWPILFSEYEIIWVVGFQINDRYQIKKETKKVLKIGIEKETYEN